MLNQVFLMGVPESLIPLVKAGTAYVSGALVKDSVTHQVIQHLQPTRMLSKALLSTTPLGAVMNVAALGLQGLQNYQLLRLQELVRTTQTIASVAAVASVLNLGVSVGGFALVLSRLKSLQTRIDKVSGSVDKLLANQQADLLADFAHVAERAEDSFELDASLRQARWSECEDRLHHISLRLTQRLAADGLSLESEAGVAAESQADLARLWTADHRLASLGMLVNAHGIRCEVLLCLGRPAKAAEVSQQMAQALKNLPSEAKLLALVTAPIGAMTTPQRSAHVAKVAGLSRWITSVSASLEQQALIHSRLAQDRVDTLAYVETVRNSPSAELLCYEHRLP